MPLLKSINLNNRLMILVWKINEDSTYFSDLDLSCNSLNRLDTIKSEHQKRGFLSVRKLLCIAGYCDQDLYYLENGKPCLKDKKHISISHTQKYAAIVISEAPAGIDIEKCRLQLFKIKHKFLNSKEIEWSSKKISLKMLTVLWCCKEALYKLYPNKGLSLTKIRINDFEIKHRVATGSILEENWSRSYNINFEFIEDHVLVFATQK